MPRTKRTIFVEAVDTLLRNRIVATVRAGDWELLEAVAALVVAEAPLDLAITDPALYAGLRNAITQFHLRGWSNMTPERVRAVAAEWIRGELTTKSRSI